MRLIEVQPFEYRILDEGKKDGVLLTLEGVVQRADAKNANNRVYPKTLWTKIMSDADTNERIRSRRMLGTLDHPKDGVTHTEKVSHVVTEHQLMPNGEVRGKLEILDTPCGRIAESLFRAKVKLGVSSRGDGSVSTSGNESVVQNDFFLETYDLVLKPSTAGAFPSIVESATEEDKVKHDEAILEAVDNLVKGTTDTKTLLECFKIVNLIDNESISKPINEKIEDKLSNKESNNNLKEKNKMPETKNLSPDGLSPELAAFLKEQVDRGIKEAVEEKEAIIADLNTRIVDLTKVNESSSNKLEAAEKLLDEATRKIKELDEASEYDEELQTRYDAAVDLLDEAIDRLKGLGETERRLTAAEGLLAASIERHKEEAVASKADELLSDVSESVAEKFLPFLQECTTPDEVEEKFKSLSSLMEEVKNFDSKEPLPTKVDNNLNESKKQPVTESNKVSDFVTSRLLKRVAG